MENPYLKNGQFPASHVIQTNPRCSPQWRQLKATFGGPEKTSNNSQGKAASFGGFSAKKVESPNLDPLYPGLPPPLNGGYINIHCFNGGWNPRV